MNSEVESVLTAALDLPEAERLELVEALIVSFQPSDQPPFDETWRAVIERRSSELQSNSVIGIPWSQMRCQGLGTPDETWGDSKL